MPTLSPCISDLESSARGAITKDGDASLSDAGLMQTGQYPERKRFTRTEPPRRRLRSWPPALSSRSWSGQPLLSDERGTLASLTFRLPSSSPLPLRRPAGGGAAKFSSTRSLIHRQCTDRDRSQRGARGALISLDTPPPARFRDRTPHGGRLLTLFGRARDSALHRPEPPRRAVWISSEAAGAVAVARSRG